jgi:hypothetical protein
MTTPQADFQLIRMLSDRLERISVDSIWAHRASGVRGALLRHLELHEKNLPDQAAQLRTLIATAFQILEKAAIKRIS